MLEQTSEIRQKNLELLNEIEHLPDNWNGYGASKIDATVVEHVRHVLRSVHVQPQMIVPTGRGTIQLEYEETNGKYLELDVGAQTIDILYQPNQGDDIEEEHVSDARVLELIQRYHAE